MPDREPGRWPTIDKEKRARGLARLRSIQLREGFALTPAQRIQQLDDLVSFERVLAAHRPPGAEAAAAQRRSQNERAWRERRR